MATTQSISFVRGTTFTFSINITDEYGSAFEFESGDVLKFGIKERKGDDGCILTKYLMDGATQFTLLPVETMDLDVGTYYYDVSLQRGTNFYNIIECSTFELRQNVTEYGTDSASEAEDES